MENELMINSIILLTIKRIGINGEGIGYYKRKAIFVEKTLIDEVVEVQITKVFEKYCYGEVVKFKTLSKERVVAPCSYYDKCGGCQLQHMNYPYQLKMKKEMLHEAFEKYLDGVKSVKINDTLGMDECFNYRNKTQLPTRHDGNKVVVGIYEKDSNRLVYIDKCIVENRLIQETMSSLLDYLTKANIDVYNPRFKQGNLRNIVIRAFEETSNVSITFVIIKNDLRLIKIFNECINIKNVVSVNYTINNDFKSVEIINSKVINLQGSPYIEGKLGNLKFELSVNSFFQLNTKQTLTLYNEVKKQLNPTGIENIVDLCCGIGSIGLYLANEVKEVRGIDINIDSIENARKFASLNNINNAKYYCGNILKNLVEFEKENFKIDCVIIDPPRKGIELSLLNYFQKSKIKKIIYVSCNPSTLAKNINHLQKEYMIKNIQPIDMFPNTASVEAVVTLIRK